MVEEKKELMEADETYSRYDLTLDKDKCNDYSINVKCNNCYQSLILVTDKGKKMRDELKGKLIKCHFCKCELTPEELIFK